MTTAELLEALARKYPNGVSFEPMAVRLLLQKTPFKHEQIKDLKAEMFQLGSGLWFSREMISDDDTWLAFEGQAKEWLMEFGCFSVEQLFRDFCGVLRNVLTLEDCAAILRHLGYTITVWKKGGYFCSQSPPGLDVSLVAISKKISGWLEDADGTLTFHEIEQKLPHLTAEALESIRTHLLPEIHKAEIGEMTCWRSMESITLPEDFSKKLTTIIDTLVALDEKVTAAKLEFALNLFYRIRFREEYFLLDNGVFMHVCAKHYQGENDVFSNKSKSLSVSGRSVRSHTRFLNLNVPIGAELVFRKDNHVTCTVLDDSNHVKFKGRAWSISALTIHLLGVSSANGFCYFSYEGEILWERRLRLERADKPDECQAAEVLPSAEAQDKGHKIIGLEGRPLSPSTWRAFRADGKNPRVAVWAHRVENGESLEQIARETGYAVSTMKVMISNFHLYIKVCRLNGILPGRDANV